jgi:predicted ATP-binding protein involved in virulence
MEYHKLIIKRFRAEKVFGYMEFDIKFNNDINFLVGGNGSGKTTALKLMNALINPNFKDLIQMQFTKVSLDIEYKDEIITILAESVEDEKILTTNKSDEKLVLPSYSSAEFDFYANRNHKLDELIEDISRKNADHSVVKIISQIQSPVFLGLDRRKEDSVGSKDDFFLEREVWLNDKNNRAARARRLIKGSIGLSLMETEMLVQNSYRRMRDLENKHSNRLRDSILMSAFKYTNFDQDSFTSDIRMFKSEEKAALLERRKEINEAISNIVGKDSGLSNEVDKFFNEITSLFEQMGQAEEGFNIEWLLNKAQIERMTNIIEIIDDHKSKIDKLFKPIDNFLETVNCFYKDSNKTLEVNTVGQLVVNRPNGDKCSIEGLSSGERQLLVIFARAYFNSNQGAKTAFIIDEPELSLHLGWQEKFSDTIFSIAPKTQFILATHSPEIIGNLKNKAVRCR